MKTTLEIPDKLLQRIKLRAVRRNLKLKDAIAHLLEVGLTVSADAELPRTAPRPVRLKGVGPIDIRSIEAAINAGRD